MSATRRLFLAFSVAAALTPGLATPVQAQTQATGSTTSVDSTQRAEEVRAQFMAVMKKYPPELGRILKLDPGLFHNEAYMAPYPALKTYIAQHPEIPRNPAYYLENYYSGYYAYRSPGMEMFENLAIGVSIFFVTLTCLGAFGWLVRTLVDYRRWQRLSKVQAETHTKLLDRFTANDELLAYVQSPAGSKFLQSAPISLEAGPGARISAPFGRILLSAQAGVVLAAAGLGLYYVSGRVDQEMTQPLYTLGIFSLFVGIGFVASAALSFVLSKRLGLLEPPPPAAGWAGRQDA
jgi:hypothetical protein